MGGVLPLFQYFQQFHLTFMIVLSCLPFSLWVTKRGVLPLAFGEGEGEVVPIIIFVVR